MMKEFFSDAGYAVFDTLPIIKGISEKLTEYQETEPAEQLRIYLDTLFDGMDPVDIVIDGSYDERYSKWKPKGKGLIEYAGRVKLARIERDQAYNAERGVWIRCNPCRHEPNCVTRTPNRKGKIPYGVEDEDITFFRYCLIEFDNMPREDQIEVVTRMQLPIATLTDSGGKSVHALIRLTAATEDEYRNKVGRLHDTLHRFGLQQDTANINPSRLTRLPGVRRGPEMQRLIAVNLGLNDLDEWFDFIGHYLGDLPEPEAGKKSSGPSDPERIRYHLPPAKLGEGERHAGFVKIIGSLWSRGVPQDVIHWFMQHFNTDFCEIPKDPETVEADVNDICGRYEFGTARRREIVDINGIPPMVFDHTSRIEPDDTAKRYFHSYSDKGVLNGVYDAKIAEAVEQGTHAFVLGGKLYLYDNGVFKPDTKKGTNCQTIIRKFLFDKYRKSDTSRKIYEYILTDGSIAVGQSEINLYPRPYCVNFQNTVLDLETMDQYAPSPEYRMINQIPHTWPPADNMDNDTIVHDYLENLFPDPDTREMVLQFLGYMMTIDRSLQKCLILRGEGGCGKSDLLHMADAIIGPDNYKHMSIQKLQERFASWFLFGKLANIYADLPSKELPETDIFKTVVGGDITESEEKSGDCSDLQPYCKMLFSANQIPKSKDDSTSAYYRRLLIAPIPTRENQVELENQTERLMNHIGDFLVDIVSAAHRMLTQGFCESDESKREVDILYIESDTVRAWMHDTDATLIDADTGKVVDPVKRDEVYAAYCRYCNKEERRMLTKNGFFSNLREKNVPEVCIHGEYYFRIKYGVYPPQQQSGD